LSFINIITLFLLFSCNSKDNLQEKRGVSTTTPQKSELVKSGVAINGPNSFLKFDIPELGATDFIIAIKFTRQRKLDAGKHLLLSKSFKREDGQAGPGFALALANFQERYPRGGISPWLIAFSESALSPEVRGGWYPLQPFQGYNKEETITLSLTFSGVTTSPSNNEKIFGVSRITQVDNKIEISSLGGIRVKDFGSLQNEAPLLIGAPGGSTLRIILEKILVVTGEKLLDDYYDILHAWVRAKKIPYGHVLTNLDLSDPTLKLDGRRFKVIPSHSK
jgi:hypothetical protein